MPPERLLPAYRDRLWAPESIEDWFPEAPPSTGEVWFERPSDPLPILIKFVFTEQNLSVQVHPPDAYARRHHDSCGKTEMWYVMRARAGAQIAGGFRKSLAEDRLRASALSGEIMELLAWQDAAAGDTFFLPAGTVHALGAGLMLCEIQQNCDLTYRLYDYGRGRELHLEHAVNVSDRGKREIRQTARDGVLVACEYFTVSKRALSSRGEPSTPANRFELWVVLDGIAEIDGQATRAGDVWYIPPDCPPFETHGEASLLVASG
jgi:mannose-6-phosphate isomerase